MKTICLAAIMFCVLVSCEDIIEIDLDSMESTIVIEGIISDMSDHCIVNLSKTVDYFEPGIYPKVPNAIVRITDEDGNVTSFEETGPGEYTSEILEVIPGNEYTLDILAEGEPYSASTTMPKRVEIESLSYILPPSILDLGEGFMVYCQVMDPVEEKNHYRMKAYNISDTALAGDSKMLFNDNFMNGNKMRMDWELETFQIGDTVIVELQTLDQSSYDFYHTMFSVTGSGFFSASNPANALTNLSNGAMGYFGTYTVSRDTLVILPMD